MFLFILVTEPPYFMPRVCNDSQRIGLTCNIFATPCDISKPCQNAGTCTNNISASHGYVCKCLSGFEGTDCQIDIRPRKPNTCWNNGTSFRFIVTE
jgi:hypothetical protein